MTKHFFIDTERVMKEASLGEFTYLSKSLTQQPIIYFKEGRKKLILDDENFPCIWYYYRDCYSPTKIPTLFYYIVKYAQKELLTQLYAKHVLDSWCTSTIVLEAILINNKEFEDEGWIYLEDLFNKMTMNVCYFRLNIHPSLYNDGRIFGRVLCKIQENKGRLYYDKLYEQLRFTFNNNFCKLNDTWFENKEVRTFYETHIKIDYDTIHYHYMKHLVKAKEREGCLVILGLVLDPFLPKDIISHIISLYIV